MFVTCFVLMATPADSAEPPKSSNVSATKSTENSLTPSNHRESNPGDASVESEADQVASEPIRLDVRGSFEISFGDRSMMRGQGSTTIQLDAATAKSLERMIGLRVETEGRDGESLWGMLQTLSKTLESTSEILRSLSDPKTQEALRQTQQLLELLPKSSTE